ncbi:MAG: MMPL family transporter [Pontimonas sp.]|nr:MMPL family transporter [Pontimonas sp.]MDP4816824.1 MMPL family transporter [Pontimonas sp.]
MNAIIRFITGPKTAWVTLLIGLIFAVLSFTVFAAEETNVSPDNGLPDDSEVILVEQALAEMPGSEGTAAVVVLAKSSGEFTDEDIVWLQGEFDPMIQMPAGGANELFTEFSNVEVMGELFVPPATISEDNTTAVLTIPMDEIDDVDEQAERIVEVRAIIAENVPAGIEPYVTGPEGFQVDLAGVFAGADFTLLLATVLIVIFLLLVTYRSPILWIVPLLVVGTADGMAGQIGRNVAAFFNITADGSITGILSVLVFGAGTNYALLLIARYKEELLTTEDRHEAMAKAVKGAGPAILASGGTVALALLTLSFAELGGNRALGLVCASGIVVAMIAALGVLPAAIVVFGRGLFWPFVPRFGGVNKSDTGWWAKLGKGVSRRPITVAILGIAVLGGLSVGATGITIGLPETEQFRVKPEAVTGIEVLAEAFPAGASAPTQVIAVNDRAEDVVEAALASPLVASAEIVNQNDDFSRIDVVLDAEGGSEEAYGAIESLRENVQAVPGANALVGGDDATRLAVKQAYERDQLLVIPLILVLVFIVLVLLLKALVAPILLLGSVVLSFFSAMGAAWLIFQNVFGMSGLDFSVFLYSFLFLVALGVDYNIFLVSRAREESANMATTSRQPTRQAMIKALGATGGVITSAGILLAAVFAVLGVLPLIALFQIGIIVGIGVLIDTLLVRTVVVPALAFITGDSFWWPRKKLTASKFA